MVQSAVLLEGVLPRVDRVVLPYNVDAGAGRFRIGRPEQAGVGLYGWKVYAVSIFNSVYGAEGRLIKFHEAAFGFFILCVFCSFTSL